MAGHEILTSPNIKNARKRANKHTLLGHLLIFSTAHVDYTFCLINKCNCQDFFDLSLERLGLDHVEILYLHNNTTKEDVQNPALLEALQKAKKAGKARFIGTTTHSNEPAVIRATIEAKIYDVVLTAYNFRQDYRDEVRKAVAEAAAAGIGIVAMKTQAGAYWDKERQQPTQVDFPCGLF